LATAGFAPIKPVEFHWYAAEEGGGLGSKDIVKYFVETKREVEAMIQFVRLI
jgi:bacterial leucyl aminopeptidase